MSGAVAQGVNYDLPLRYKSERHPSEKQRIGALAAAMVRAAQVAGLNGGTTTTEVARALAMRPDLSSGGPFPTVTVVTNALNIATELAVRQHIKIVATGGVARPQSYELTGPLATGVWSRSPSTWPSWGWTRSTPRPAPPRTTRGKRASTG